MNNANTNAFKWWGFLREDRPESSKRIIAIALTVFYIGISVYLAKEHPTLVITSMTAMIAACLGVTVAQNIKTKGKDNGEA